MRKLTDHSVKLLVVKFILAIFLLFFSLGSGAQSLADEIKETAELFFNGQYEKVIPKAEKAAASIKELMGENNDFYIGLVIIQATSHENIFQYAKAESLYIQAGELLKKTAGEKSKSFTAFLHNLASLYYRTGQYEMAEKFYLRAQEITKSITGENDSSYATTLNSMAVLYETMGQYEKAEPLFLRALEIRKKILGENHPEYATVLNNMAIYYKDIGQFEKAESLFLRAQEIRKRTVGENHRDYAASLNNLASCLEDLGQYAKAESLYIKSGEIRKKTTGENHPDYAASLNNLAGLYTVRGDYAKAEPLLIRATEIWKQVLGENHPDYATALNNLAAFYRKSQMQYTKSETLYQRAIQLRKKLLGENHPLYADSQTDLALLYSQMGQYSKAEPLLITGSTIFLQNITSTFSILSEKEKTNYLKYNISTLDINTSFLYNYPKASAAVIKNSLNLLLGFKSLALADTKNMLESVRNNKDTVIQRIFNNWLIQKNLLAKQYSLAVDKRMPAIQKIEEETETLEKELATRSSAFRNGQSALRISMQDIQKNLAQEEVAVEFVRFKFYHNNLTDSVLYAAYIFGKNDTVPHFVPLCEEKQLARFFTKTGKAIGNIKSIYDNEANDKINKKTTTGDSLYVLIFKPLLPYLVGIRKINYSPAGLLHRIAFHALPAGDSQLLIDKYELNQHISTRQLALTKENTLVKNKSILLFGDAAFSMDSMSMIKQKIASRNISTIYSSEILRSGSRDAWVSLPGTATELSEIQTLFEKYKINSLSFTQEKATEEQFKLLSGNSSSVLHLATHGFFLPDLDKKGKERFAIDGQNALRLADDPMLRSGIVLAGVNRVWNGQPPIDGREDGIVTAYEISQLDLRNTNLVVLSACETALGDIKGNEGVFGLQRAFKLAGVKNMLLSLWKVPDAETAELMIFFYTYYLQGKTVREAFTAAQQEMRNRYKPYFWAAFVLIE
jgi:CHAT domain-containing protein/Flp pilus assembly protein TadD